MGGGGRGGARKPQKGKSIAKDLKVTLEEVYNGKLYKIPHNRKQCCEGCDGKGGANQKNAVLVKDKEWSSKCKCLDPECTNKANSPVPTVEEKEWQQMKKISARSATARSLWTKKPQLNVPSSLDALTSINIFSTEWLTIFQGLWPEMFT